MANLVSFDELHTVAGLSTPSRSSMTLLIRGSEANKGRVDWEPVTNSLYAFKSNNSNSELLLFLLHSPLLLSASGGLLELDSLELKSLLCH